MRQLLCNDRCPGWDAQKTVESPQLQWFGRRPVLGQGCCARWCNDLGPRNAWFDYGYMFCIIQGGFWKNFFDFLRDLVSRLLRSILRPGRHVVDTGSGTSLTGFAGLTHLALCSHDCRQFADRCFSCSRAALGNLYIIFHEPPVFSACHLSNFFARVDFLEPSSTHRCECSRAGGWR